MKPLKIKTNDNNYIVANIYEANNSETVLIIASATGVKQSFYKKFAEYLCTKGITVITFDYTGIGESLQTSIKKIKTNVAHWGKVDLDSVIKYAKNNYSDANLIVVGHSIGGQLIGLAQSSLEVDKILLIATQSGYWKLWKGNNRLKMWANWYLLFPILTNLFSYMPSKKISGMENLPKNVAKQWSSWGRKSNYLFDEFKGNDLFFNEIQCSILAISIENDFYAPKEAVDWFVNKFKKANIKRVHIIPSNYNSKNIGHFGMFRENFSNTLWPSILEFIKN